MAAMHTAAASCLLIITQRMIETKQLRTFKAIVEVGSFTAAGEQLNLSQPAISQQMRALEEEIGATLFVRAGRGARPTPAGDLLLHTARLVLEKLDEVQRRMAELSDTQAGVVRIGTPEPMCNYLLPPLLAELKQRFPKVDVRVTSGHTPVTLTRLAAGELDLALLPLPVSAGKMRIVEVGNDELVAIVAPAHRWSRLDCIAAREFDGEPLILYDRQSQITDLTLSFLLSAGVFPRVCVEIDHLEAIKDLVRAGVGVAIVPRWSARREVAAGALMALRLGEAGGLTRTWGVLYAETTQQSLTQRAVLQIFSDALPARLAHQSKFP